MKGRVASVFVSFIVLDFCAGRFFDEKSEAKKEIDGKLNIALGLGNTVLSSAEKEMKLVDGKGELELMKYLSTKINETKAEFEKEASAVIRTAIVLAKPVQVIYCIRSVIFNGTDKIINSTSVNQKKVRQVKLKKLEKIDFDIYAIKAIMQGMKELMEQAKKKIDEGSGSIQNIKTEALERCESAVLLLGEIEVCLHEPILNREYIRTRQSIDSDLKDLKKNLNTQLNACLK